jgi:plasmid stability protein
MATITISTLDDFTLSVLKKRAAHEGKSLEEEAAGLIRERLKRGKDPETLIARARAVSALAPADIKQTDSAELIREDRDR